jgi:hypothetical protein
MVADKPIVFQSVKTWGELFKSAKPHEGESPTIKTVRSWDWNTRKRGPKPTSKLSGYCVITGFDDRRVSLHVQPTDLVVYFFADSGRVLHCSWDTMHFEVHVYEDGTALVVLQHGQIIGSHWLAMIDASTIPSFEGSK